MITVFMFLGNSLTYLFGSGVERPALQEALSQGTRKELYTEVAYQYGILGMPQFACLHHAEKFRSSGKSLQAAACLVGALLLQVALEPGRLVVATNHLLVSTLGGLLGGCVLAAHTAYQKHKNPAGKLHEYARDINDLRVPLAQAQRFRSQEARFAEFARDFGDVVQPTLPSTRQQVLRRGENNHNALALERWLEDLRAFTRADLHHGTPTHARIAGLSAQQLGCSEQVTPQSAYRRKVLHLHPDRLEGGGHQLSPGARDFARALSDVYACLRDIVVAFGAPATKPTSAPAQPPPNQQQGALRVA